MDWGDNAGFINDSIAEEAHNLTSTVSVGNEDRSKPLAAVSVSQVAKLTRPNEGLMIHGKKIHHITIVAFVYEIIDINPQKIHILIDDFTAGGPLEVSHIMGDSGTPGDDPSLSMFSEQDVSLQDSKNTRTLNSIKVGDYLRITGCVKYNQDKSNIVAYNIKFLDDINEIAMHKLQVVRDSMYLERSASGMKPLSEKQPIAGANNNARDNQQSKSEFGILSVREKHILKFVRERSGDNGVSLATIDDNFKAFTRTEICDALNALNGEGLCWQGDTEDVWFANP